MAKNKKNIGERFAVTRDAYGRRVFPASFSEAFKVVRSRGLQDSQNNLRTNTALLGAIARGGDIAPTVTNPEVYHDPGHVLTGTSDDDLLRSSAALPEHRIGTRPERLLTVDSNRTRDFVDGVVSEVGEAVSSAKVKRASGAGAGSPSGQAGQS